MASRSDTELLTEHFGYPPVSLLDEIINSINFLAERALHSIEQGLLNAPPASLGFRPSKSSSSRPHPQPPANASGTVNGDENAQHQQPESEEEAAARRHRNEVESGTHQLETLLWASIDKNFDKFEIYVMRNILCLRREEMQWIRLGHYEGLEFAAGQQQQRRHHAGGGEGGEEEEGEGGQPSVESVNKLRRRLQASQKLNAMLVAERARNAALLAEMRRLVGTAQRIKTEPAAAAAQGEQRQQEGDQKPPFGFLHDKGDLTTGDAETPLTTTAAFTLSQLQALRELSAALRGALPRLAAAEEDVGGEAEGNGKKSWRRERLEYVETATRKHLENVRGLELGKDGEVRDGEWDGGGRSLARGEVESLERVVNMLGGAGNRDENRMDES
ncbi:hypothetical protein VTI74DRAFT_4360 [Chaetomium olivicolor]